jgi:two-component system CheB/CheR fusion protein
MHAILQEDEARQRDCAFCRHGFLAILSHELRNPLAALSNSLYVLKNSQPGEPRAERAMAVIDRQIHRLASLVDSLGQAATIGRGRIELNRVRTDLCEFLRNTLADHEALFSARGVELQGELPKEPIHVSADPIRLAQIVGNLLQNAAQFTPRGGKVVLILTEESTATAARIQVRDSGIGLEPGIRERLFLPFSQADNSLARTAGGLGLGLALAKGLVDLHGGSIRADSAGPGLGTTFTVDLPLLNARAQTGVARL